MIVLLVGYFVGKSRKDEEGTNGAAMRRNAQQDENGKLKRKGIVRLLSIIPAILVIIAFILTENMRNAMVWVDQWTLMMVIIAAVQIVVAVFTKKSRKDDDEEADAMHYANK